MRPLLVLFLLFYAASCARLTLRKRGVVDIGRRLTLEQLHDLHAPSARDVADVARGAPFALVGGRRWQIDADVPPHALVVEPVRGQRRSLQQPSGYNFVVARTLASLYNVTTTAARNPLRIAIVSEDENDGWSQADLTAFEGLMGVSPAARVTSYMPSLGVGSESSLDVQSVVSLAPRGTNVSFIENDSADFGQFCHTILAMPQADLPDVVSLSWSTVDGDYADIEQCLQLLAAAGVSLVVASGDTGAAGVNALCNATGGFQPEYPATSAYATAVGATRFTGSGSFTGSPICSGSSTLHGIAAAYNVTVSDTTSYASCYATGSLERAVDTAVDGFSSGGGFAGYSARPPWQDAAVGAYLAGATTFPSRDYWSASSRAFPDVAMYGAGGAVVVGGRLYAYGGTSQSAPLFAAAMLYVVDWYKTNVGQSPGLLSPMLYALGEGVFNDVTVGDNNGTERVERCPLGGFSAAAGWDAVTGLGTPNIGMMLRELDRLLAENVTLLLGAQLPPSTYRRPTMFPYWALAVGALVVAMVVVVSMDARSY